MYADNSSNIIRNALGISILAALAIMTVTATSGNANVFSYFDKAPLAAIAELAESVGAVVKPDRTGKSFSVVPRYSVSPCGSNRATLEER